MKFLADEKIMAHGAKLSNPKFEILMKVREAEEKAERIIADAESQKQKTIEDAQKKAMTIQAFSAEKMKAESEAELKEFYKELAKKREKIISDCNKKSLELRKAGEKKLPKAVDFLFESFRTNVTK